MTERLLQYIWLFQYFNKSELLTLDGEALQVIHPGKLNTNQGPDFLDAKIKINKTTWAGNIELHINASDWKNHEHDSDPNYKNIILHVVWHSDIDLKLPFSSLELESRVSHFLLKKYEELMEAGTFIPCEKSISQVNDITWVNWKERLLVDRLESKSAIVFDYLKRNQNFWEESFWWMLARNFGAKVNSQAFEKIAQSIPLKILGKHKNQIHQLEALLLGQAGLLDKDFVEDYPIMLKKEYQFLNKKYKLPPPQMQLFFMRMRPANFPTIRLAQLAMLIHKSAHLFSAIIEKKSLESIRKLLNLSANDYWNYHYQLDEPGEFREKNLGTQMIDNLLINTIVPMVFAYGLFHKDEHFKDKALQWLLEIKAEKNNITKGFIALEISNKNAFDSQALIQLKNEYCQPKKCLDCAIGNSLLKQTNLPSYI